MEIICSECGQAFDGDQCWVCVARMADIEETFSFSLPVALAGIIGTILAIGVYPPLKSNSLAIYRSRKKYPSLWSRMDPILEPGEN